MPLSSAATKDNTYHANKIPLDHGIYIAAQGPCLQSNDSFFAMMAENDIAISVSLVDYSEFKNTRKNNILFTNNKINSESNNQTQEEYLVYSLFSDKKNNLRYDLFLINNKFHIRIYDFTWEHGKKNNPKRIIALACFIEKLKQLNIFNRKENTPLSINCSAGSGRTAVLILTIDSIRSYLNGAFLSVNDNAIHSTTEKILTARKFRPRFAHRDAHFISAVECITDTESLDCIFKYFSLEKYNYKASFQNQEIPTES